MTYEKQMWVNLPDQTTPISAERLNHIEDGIYQAQTDANEGIEGLATKADKSNTLNGYGITNAYTKDEVDKFVDDLDEKKLDKDDLPVPLPPMTLAEWEIFDKSDLEDGTEVIIKDDEAQPKLPPMTKREWELLDKTDIPDGAEVVITDDSLDGVEINNKFKSTQQCFADRWVSGKTYYVGDIAIWADRLWKCSVQTSTEEPSDSASCWFETSVDNELKSIAKGLAYEVVSFTCPANSQKILVNDVRAIGINWTVGWSAFVMNRSGFANFNIFGDGNALYLRNNTSSEVTGRIVLYFNYT